MAGLKDKRGFIGRGAGAIRDWAAKMRVRIICIMIVTTAVVVACTRKQSLYIDPGSAAPPAERTAHR
jgi:hypothetical protein